MKWVELASAEELSAEAARMFLATILSNPKSVLGLPTGRTPIGMYARVVHECSREYHCFRDVTTFNLDEYVGVPRTHPGSYFTYMREHLFTHIDIERGNAHIPDGSVADPDAECARYESQIRESGGMDLMFLGLGRNGHIGFNEPGSPFDARTRVVTLTESTRNANADCFPQGDVPSQAITMGIGTILESRRIVLLVSGRGKKEAIARLRSGVQETHFPASALWQHHDVTVLTAIEE